MHLFREDNYLWKFSPWVLHQACAMSDQALLDASRSKNWHSACNCVTQLKLCSLQSSYSMLGKSSNQIQHALDRYFDWIPIQAMTRALFAIACTCAGHGDEHWLQIRYIVERSESSLKIAPENRWAVFHAVLSRTRKITQLVSLMNRKSVSLVMKDAECALVWSTSTCSRQPRVEYKLENSAPCMVWSC